MFNAGPGELKKKPQHIFFPFHKSVPGFGKGVAAEDVPAIASFLKRCLRLNQRERATADELLSDPLFAGVDD